MFFLNNKTNFRGIYSTNESIILIMVNGVTCTIFKKIIVKYYETKLVSALFFKKKPFLLFHFSINNFFIEFQLSAQYCFFHPYAIENLFFDLFFSVFEFKMCIIQIKN